MHIGLPREIKDGEYRVALTPEGVRALVRAGHGVGRAGAGAESGFADQDYLRRRAVGGPWAAVLVSR